MIRIGDITIDRSHCRITTPAGYFQFRRRGSGKHRPSHHKNFLFETACHLLLAGPKTPRQLFELTYANDPTGGPTFWNVQQQVCIFHCKYRLLNIGLVLRKITRGGQTAYWLEFAPGEVAGIRLRGEAVEMEERHGETRAESHAA